MITSTQFSKTFISISQTVDSAVKNTVSNKYVRKILWTC